MAHLFRRNDASRSSHTRPLLALLLAALTLGLSSCGAFFQCEGKADCPATTATTTTSCTAAAATTVAGTVYGYATNSTCGSSYLNGYTLSTALLSAATGSPFNLDFTPSAVVVTPANTFVYVASDSALTTGDIYGYSLGSGGQLSILASGSPLASENASALEVSADGKYLFSLNSDGLTLEQYTIDTSTGLLTAAANYSVSSATNGGAVVPTSLKFAPSNDFLVATYGTGGAEIFSYNATTGALAPTSVITPSSTSVGVYGATIDANNYLYVAFTNGLEVFSTTAAGVPTFLKSYTVGNGPHQVVVNSASSYLYVANFSDSTISGFTIGTGGTLTAMSGSPFNGPTNVIALGLASNGSNLLASGYNTTNGLQLFTIGSGGAITLAASTGTAASTIIPAAVAMSH
jgi:6-phosphogluconolactonase (cycloisomerase 2 family)